MLAIRLRHVGYGCDGVGTVLVVVVAIVGLSKYGGCGGQIVDGFGGYWPCVGDIVTGDEEEGEDRGDDAEFGWVADEDDDYGGGRKKRRRWRKRRRRRGRNCKIGKN